MNPGQRSWKRRSGFGWGVFSFGMGEGYSYAMTEEEFRSFLIEQNATPERIEELVGQVSPDVIRKFAKDFGQDALDDVAIEAFASVMRKDFSQRVLLQQGKGTLEDFWDTHPSFPEETQAD